MCTLGHDAKVATACPECKRKTAEHFAKVVFDKAENDPSRNRKISPRAAAAEKDRRQMEAVGVAGAVLAGAVGFGIALAAAGNNRR